MTDNAIVSAPTNDIERVVIMGDLSSLSPADRLNYYRAVCQSIGLNPLTKPFDYITLNGKLTLYARKDATDQLRSMRGVSIVKLEREKMDDIYIVTAYAQTQDGRQDSSIGAVSIGTLKGDALANAIMKAETKSKRRVTLSICGLGMLDETELETIPDARPVVTVTPTTNGNGHAPEPAEAPAHVVYTGTLAKLGGKNGRNLPAKWTQYMMMNIAALGQDESHVANIIWNEDIPQDTTAEEVYAKVVAHLAAKQPTA